MAIEIVGGIYCPLSSRDPKYRLHQLIEQTGSRLVLVHWLTKRKFSNKICCLDLSSLLTNYSVDNDINVDQLSHVTIESDSLAYIIFTSGSTGLPKAVCTVVCTSYLDNSSILLQAQVRHRNFSEFMHSATCIDTLKQKDTVVQMARCSFDIHIQDIIGSLWVGATIVMLHSGGTLDFNYLSTILEKKQITYMSTVPSLYNSFLTFVGESKNENGMIYLRSVLSAGM